MLKLNVEKKSNFCMITIVGTVMGTIYKKIRCKTELSFENVAFYGKSQVHITCIMIIRYPNERHPI